MIPYYFIAMHVFFLLYKILLLTHFDAMISTAGIKCPAENVLRDNVPGPSPCSKT